MEKKREKKLLKLVRINKIEKKITNSLLTNSLSSKRLKNEKNNNKKNKNKKKQKQKQRRRRLLSLSLRRSGGAVQLRPSCVRPPIGLDRPKAAIHPSHVQRYIHHVIGIVVFF